MLRVLVPAAVFAIVSLSSPAASARAQFGGMSPGGGFMSGVIEPPKPGSLRPYPVKVETAGGAVSGTLRLASVVLQGDLGLYEIKPDKVAEIRLDPRNPNEPVIVGPGGSPHPGTVVTRSGESLKGRVIIQKWQLETDLGVLTLSPETLRLVSFSGREKERPKDREKPAEREPEKEKEKPRGR